MKNRIVELKKRLQPENAAVLARFAADGVDISSEKEVAFFIEMPSKDDVFKCSSEMRCQFKRKAFHGSVTHTEPQKTVYYRYDIVLPMTADAISQIEAELLSVCEEHGGTRSFWEFADQRQSTTDRNNTIKLITAADCSLVKSATYAPFDEAFDEMLIGIETIKVSHHK